MSRRSTPICRFCHARPLAEGIAGALIFFNLTATMLFVFGVAGMALAAMGTYGLVSYTVKQSTHEIGIRMALGASGLSVVRRFLARGLRLGAIGAVLGMVAALGVSQASRQRAVRRQRDRCDFLRACAGYRPRRGRSWRPSFRPGARHGRIRWVRCGISSGGGGVGVEGRFRPAAQTR